MTRADAEIAELPTDPGARLRRQRELAGLTEQQVAERLNLDSGVIVAIERDDYLALGAPVFVRGHLRRYAMLLGLTGEEILGAYDRSRAQLAPPSMVPKSREEMVLPRGRIASPWLMVGVLAFLAAAGIAAYLSAYGLRLPGASAARAVNAASGLVGPGVESAGNAALATRGGDAAVAAMPRGGNAAAGVTPGQALLSFDFRQDSWIEVYDGSGRAVLYDLGKAGTERAVSGAAPLSVTLGNAPGVALAVNGRQVSVPSPPPGQTVARFSVGRDGLPH